MLSVNEWIELLERGHKFKIYVWCRFDVANELNINIEHRIHGNALCNYIKSSSDGIEKCMCCRTCADRLAKKRGRFSAHCIHGIFEVITPVLSNGEWAATVYISNLCYNKDEAEKRILKACDKYSLSYTYALSLIEKSEFELDLKAAEKLAEAVTEIITEKLKNVKHIKKAVPEPVKRLADIAADCFSQETVKSVSEYYGINEKYLGQLFKENMGLSFCKYKNKLRLKEAAYMLGNSDIKVIDIAVAMGYDSAAYFSKKFREEYGLSPTEYRKSENKRNFNNL